MPLIAESVEHPGRLLLPGEGGVRAAKCPDLACGRAMTYVRGVALTAADDLTITRRAEHWRHQAAAHGHPGCPRAGSPDKAMTAWHRGWQESCTDRERLEVVIERGSERVRADILTRYGWAVEIQHSSIARSTVRRRERVNNGKVIWLLDAGSPTRDGDVTVHDDRLIWTASAGLDRIDATTVTVLDRGPAGLTLLPPNWTAHPAGGTVEIPMALTRAIPADTFISEWINGDTLPVNAEATIYARTATEARRRAAEAARQRDATPTPPPPPRLPQRPVCRYDGDRTDLALPMPDDDLITTTAPSRIVGHRATTLTVTPSHVGSASRCWGCGLPCTSDYCWSCQRGGSR